MTGKPKQHAEEERARIEKEEDEVTVDSDESFPASDPPSFNPGTAGSADARKKKTLVGAARAVGHKFSR